jgi:CubicO group peptidase (beta-lactamase class C family)
MCRHHEENNPTCLEQRKTRTMKKHTRTFFIVLFSILITDQAGNTVIASTGAIGASSAAARGSNGSTAPAHCSPEDVGMNAETLTRIDHIVKEGIRAGAFPGCQVLILKEGQPVYDKCFGNYTYESSRKVNPTTMYDLASLSKTTGTLLAIMKLYDNGKLTLNDKASSYLAFLRGTDKENITIRELLFHESGLPASLPFYRLALEKIHPTLSLAPVKKNASHHRRRSNKTAVRPAFHFKPDWVSNSASADFTSQVSDSLYVHNRFHEAAMQMIAATRLYSKSYCYSCVNFIVLKEIAETISGMPMDVFLNKEFFTPLQLHTMSYLPLRTHKKENVAPTLKTDFLRHGELRGYVNDPDAAFLGGVSGNAGLFASAQDVATVYQMMLNNGEMDGYRYLSAETCRLFTTTTSASGRRGLGYDKPVPAHPKSNPCSISAPMEVYGHTGYTGTCCWVDPLNKVVYVFLSNRTYPYDGKNKLLKMGIRAKIQEVMYESMSSMQPFKKQ